jgi:hypothetical protein
MSGSVKPIEDQVQVREVGEGSRVNKIDINTQSLPLPPMTINQFEEAVANIAKEIIDFGKPQETIQISNLSTNSGYVDTTQIDDISSGMNKILQAQVPVENAPASTTATLPAAVAIQEPAKADSPETTLSGIESAIAELLSKLDAVKGRSSVDMSGEGLTTRDYVDKVLGGERNLEGGNLVEAANFLGKEEGISFKQESDGSFTKMQDGEVVQSGMTQEEGNDFVEEKEKENAKPLDDATAAVSQNENPDQPVTETTIQKDVDVATLEHRPFSFDTNYLIILSYGDTDNTSKYFSTMEEIADLGQGDGFNFISCRITNGEIVSSEFVNTKPSAIDEFASSPFDYCEFSGSGVNRVQTWAHIPIAYPKLPRRTTENQLYLVNHSGVFATAPICTNGINFIYPTRV